MAIKLKVKPYCAECCDFESEVTPPERACSEWDNSTVFQTDTIIRCKNARRCEAIERYLTRALGCNKLENED